MSQIQDKELQKMILERLNEDPTIDAESIEVTADHGEVILNGHVESRDDRKWVEALVWQVPHVGAVVNHITLENT